MERGLEGLQASTSNLRERGMLYMGSDSSPEDRATPRVIERLMNHDTDVEVVDYLD